VDAPVFVAPEVLQDCARRQEEGSTEATMMQRALAADSMTIRRLDSPADP
jgi:hypothetical protein